MSNFLFKVFLHTLFKPRGKHAFLMQLKKSFYLLEIGCGNKSASFCKKIRPDSYFIGIDVCAPNSDDIIFSDEYKFTTSELFHQLIADQDFSKIDCIISNHNLEHCIDRIGVLDSIQNNCHIGTEIYIAFPSIETINFPRRDGCLNYFDDPTHASLPPDFDGIIHNLKANGFTILFSNKSYKPIFLWLIGFILEPFSSYTGKVLIGTWEFYGFESIIWARKEN